MHFRLTQKLAKKIKEPGSLPALKAHLQDGDLAPCQVADMINNNLLSYLGEGRGDYGRPREAFHALCLRIVSPPPVFEGELPPNVLKFEKPNRKS